MAKRGAAVLEMPGPEYVPAPNTPRRSVPGAGRRDPVEDFAGGYHAESPDRSHATGSSRAAVKLRLGRRLPKTLPGLVATAIALFALLAVVLWLLTLARGFLLHDPRFRLASPASIEIEGNRHLTRAQLLTLFSGDLGRDIFRVSLDDRRAELESIPWVERATIMRLLPNRLRVSLVERTPVAFVRESGHVGLVDREGVLLPMLAGANTQSQYSFPVVTGIVAADPLSTRAARMKLYSRFMAELDGSGEKNTDNLSEVDLANPEDLRAEVEEHGVHVLVHFGEGQFLERYRRVKQLLPQWHAQYPNLASADLRYEHEIPLAMAAPAAPKSETTPAAKPPTQPRTAQPGTGAHPSAAIHIKPAGTSVRPLAPALLKSKIASPTATPPVALARPTTPAPAGQTFVPPLPAKPWRPAPAPLPKPSAPAASIAPPPAAAIKPASASASISAAARAQFAAKSPANGASKPVPAHTPAQAKSPAGRPAPNPPASGKPAAGKPLAAPPSPSSFQGVPQ